MLSVRNKRYPSISRAIRRNQSGIRKLTNVQLDPLCSLDQSVGKTGLAKALAEVLFDDRSALIRLTRVNIWRNSQLVVSMEHLRVMRLRREEDWPKGSWQTLLSPLIWWGGKSPSDIFNVLLRSLGWRCLDPTVRVAGLIFKYHHYHDIKPWLQQLLRDDKTVGFELRIFVLTRKIWKNECSKKLKKTCQVYQPYWWKVVFHSLSSQDMQEVVKTMVKPLIASLAEKGIDLKLQASTLKLLAPEGMIC